MKSRITKSVLVLALAGALFAALPSVSLADGFTITAPLTGHAVTSCSDITMSGGVSIDSAGVNATPPTNKGEVLTNGNITLSGTSTINGDVTIGPAKHVTTSGTAHVTGTTTVATSTFNCQPVDMVALKNIVSVTNNNGTFPQTTQHHTVLVGTNLTMSGNDSITIPAGTYYFTNVAISGNSSITLGGPVHIFVNGAVSISGGSVIGGNGYGLHFWVSGSSFALSGNSAFKAYVYAPSAAVTLSAATLTGGVFANTVAISGNSHITRAIDDDPPTVAITSPANNSVPSDPTHVVVSGTVSDGETDVSVSVNGHPATIAANGTWTVTISVSGSPSPAAINAVATDAAGNTTTATIHVVTAIGTPPVISLTSPVPNSTIATRVTNLSGSAGTATSLTVNGTAATIAGGNWTLNGFDFGPDGMHTLTIIGTNAAGPATINPVVTTDTTAPTINATVAPTPNAQGWNKSSATVTFTCSDVTSGVATCPPPVTVSAETAGQIVSGTATDKAGNSKSASVTVKLDLTPPSVAITSPAAGVTVSSSSLPVSGTASDALSGVLGVTCNGTPAVVTGGGFNCSVTLVTGDNTITVTATDVAGNPATTTRLVTYNPDTQPPAITITVPVNNAFVNHAAVTVSGTATDDIAVATVTVNGAPATLTGSNWTATTTLPGPDGLKTITAVATDTSNKPTTATVQVTLDTTLPTVAITSPATGTSTTSATQTVTGTVSDVTSGVAGVTCNGAPATVTGGTFSCSVTLVAGDNPITAMATDKAGNASPAVIHVTYTPDTQAPVITITAPANGSYTRQTSITVSGTATDDVSVASVTVNGAPATLTGITWTATTTLSAPDEPKTITAVATDGTGKHTSALVVITLDTTGPLLAVTSPAAGAALTNPQLAISGTVTDALSGVSPTGVKCNGAAATVNVSGGTFTCNVTLLDGDNTIAIAATDNAGNSSSASLHVSLDTRAPQLTVVAPLSNACLNATSIAFHGTAADANLQSVSVQLGATSIPATVDKTTGVWSATATNVPEGKQVFAVVATDTLGHSATTSVVVNVNRTAPVVSILENGQPFIATIVNRPVALSVRVTDADPNTVIVTTLDGAPYASSSSIAAEGPHTLSVTATDCAGGTAQKSVQFTIDRTPPSLLSTTPASGSTSGTMPQVLQGTVSEAATVSVNGGAAVATGAGNTFSVTLPFAEGANSFLLHLTDAAGNTADVPYSVTIHTGAPVIVVQDHGVALVNGATYTRAVTPVILVTPSNAQVSALLDLVQFTSGTTVTNDLTHTLTVTATDTLGHAPTTKTVVFIIDTQPPAMKINVPANGASLSGDTVTVTGTCGDAVSVTVNGLAVTPASGAFTATVALDPGQNLITATGFDAAGNAGSDSVTVTRAGTAPGLLITYPVAQTTTNRPTTLVTGQLLTPASVQSLTIESSAGTSTTGPLPLTFDASGAFRVTDVKLFEGSDTIKITLTSTSGLTNSATVSLTADLTLPTVRILAGGQAFDNGAQFATSAVLTADASDPAVGGVTQPTPATTLQVDGLVVAAPATITATGGHTAIAIATDAAGNEARATRTFFIGTQQQATSCGVSGFDPADGAVVTSNSITLVGNSAGAAGVLINGVAVIPANGMFSGTVALPQEGPNTVRISCADASGKAVGDPVTISLVRVTGAPSLTIDTPHELDTFGPDANGITAINVSGTIGNGAIAVDVNGTPGTITGSNWTAQNVHLAEGLNNLAAHARNAAGTTAIATRRVLNLSNAPSITISSPSDGFTTGATAVDVAGTYTNLDSTTIVLSGGATSGTLAPQKRSDTTGTFVIRGVGLSSGTQQLTVTAHDALARPATASIKVSAVTGAPSIVITSPADNSSLPSSTGTSLPVTGTFIGAAGLRVDVNGTTATVNASQPNDQGIVTGTFTVTATIPTSGAAPVVARLTQADGVTAAASIVVSELAAQPQVTTTFPAAGATSVDPAVMVLVAFTAPMDEDSLRTAFVLDDASGTAVSGQFRLERDVLTFAPAAPLNPGQLYTVNISTAAKDIAGNALNGAFTSAFTVITSSPASAPQVNPVSGSFCSGSVTISGTATAGAVVEIDLGGVPFSTTADTNGAFSLAVPVAQQSAFAVARVRVHGADGSYSPSVDVPLQVDCSSPQVVSASYDRTANTVTITFSKAIDGTTVTVGAAGSVQLQLGDGTPVTGSASTSTTSVIVTPGTPDPRNSVLVLTVTTAVKDTTGRSLASAFTQTFSVSGTGQQGGGGAGYITGQIIDATNGRPLAGASVAIGATATVTTGSDGSYTSTVPEGAYAIHASATGYTDVWRQVVVPAGQGVVPIDIRLTLRGASHTIISGDVTASDGGTTTVTRVASLTIPAGTLPPASTVTLTSVGAQGLTGLLPLGWSPLAAAEVLVQFPAGVTPGAASAPLSFQVPAAASSRAITAVEYDSVRDVWNVIQPAVVITAGTAQVNITLPANSSAFALVYPDMDSGNNLAVPPPPVTGGALTGVSDVCEAKTCPAMQATSFPLNPAIVAPTDRTTATLTIDGTLPANLFPSGTAVDALVNEELDLTDGTVNNDVPFSTDLVLYRTLTGDALVADFHLAPSPHAAQVPLQVGFDHIQILPYPGRLDRGTLVGPEGGNVPSDSQVQVALPAGSTSVPLHATATSLTAAQLSAFSIAGFDVVAGLSLTLDPAATPADPNAPIQLLKPASASFVVDPSTFGAAPQLILAEVVPNSTFSGVVRLADLMTAPQAIAGTSQVSVASTPVDPSHLPVDGMVRPGQYLLLRARQPIAYATGSVRMPSGAYLGGVEVTASTLGVRDLTRTSGLFAVPVPATPASPFILTPIHTLLGQGAPYTAATVPNPGVVVPIGDLIFTLQSPLLNNVIVTGPGGGVDLHTTNGATEVSLSTGVQAVFSLPIDITSVSTASIVVSDISTGTVVPGTVTPTGSAVTWAPIPVSSGQPLAPNATYAVHVDSAIRATNGAPLGHGYDFTFSTITRLSSTQLHPEKIRILIPDASGVTTITGDPGAFPSSPPETSPWKAVALRHGNAFITQYQIPANGDGSFSLTIGNCPGLSGTCKDAVSITDEIDLEVINAAGNVAAILPLTPFVTTDGQGFIAPPTQAVTFVSADGVSLAVPAGAFDQPTTIHVKRVDDKSPFAAVQNFDNDINFYRGVQIDFDCSLGTTAANVTTPAAPCEAHKRLDVSMPVPATNFDPTGRTFLLGWLGNSVRGPHIMVVDLLEVTGGNFTTAFTPGSSQGSQHFARNDSGTCTGSCLGMSDVKDELVGINRAGTYLSMDLVVPTGDSVGFAAINGLQGDYDMFMDAWPSIYVAAPDMEQSRGQTIVPILQGQPFSVIGYDAGTGLQAFVKAYNPQPPGDPSAAYVVDTPVTPATGPYPAFALPNRIEVIDVEAESVPVPRPNFVITVNSGLITVTDDPNDKLDGGIDVTLFNTANGQASKRLGSGSLAPNGSFSVNGNPGDRVILIVGQADVDPSSPVSIVFNTQIFSGKSGTSDAGINTNLHQNGQVTVLKAEPPVDSQQTPPQPPPLPQYVDISADVTYSVDSGGRRLLLTFPSSLARGASYRISLGQTLAAAGGPGDTAGFKIGQTAASSGLQGVTSLDFDFTVRDIASLGSFNLSAVNNAPAGSVRDYALNGNVLFVAARQGGLYAFDVSDPGALTTTKTAGANKLPMAYVRNDGNEDFWAVASDQHGRVFATALGNVFGVLNTYRLEDFVNGTPLAPPQQVVAKASSVVSWVPGYGTASDLESPANRPEGIPRKFQIAVQDQTLSSDNLDEFITKVGALGSVKSNVPAGEFQNLTVILKRQTTRSDGNPNPYISQRITVENTTRDLRWSADATDQNPAQISGIIAQPGDALNIVYNQNTYAVVTIFGYGIAVMDVNAAESNSSPDRPSDSPQLVETVRTTPVALCGLTDDQLLEQGPSVIRDLSLSPETAIIPGSTVPLTNVNLVTIYGLDVHQGILDVRYGSSDLNPSAPCDPRAPNGLILVNTPLNPDNSPNPTNNPRLPNFVAAFNAAAPPPPAGTTAPGPVARFNGIQTYDWILEKADNKPVGPAIAGQPAMGQRNSPANARVERNYLLVPGYQYGLMVIDASYPNPNAFLDKANLADIIWVPAGAVAVRVIPRSHYAVVVDSIGRVLLADISNIDERTYDSSGKMIPDALFATVKTALSSPASTGDISFAATYNATIVGRADPRIVWQSQPGLVSGSLPPVIDVDTGILYAGSIDQIATQVIAALDPPIQILADLGDGNLSNVGGVIPLGVDPPSTVWVPDPTSHIVSPNASLAAFRVRVALPGNTANQLPNNQLRLAIESERVPGGLAEQTPVLVDQTPFPRAHLRSLLDGGTTPDPRAAGGFVMQRAVPDGMADQLRSQKGFNTFISPWIVAIADPRASVSYVWPTAQNGQAANKKAFGCNSCDRPPRLQGKTETDPATPVWELWSGGADFVIRPDFTASSGTSSGSTTSPATIFDNTPYAYLGEDDRLTTRIATIPGDTVRTLDTLVAAQGPPVAGGALLGTVYLHSGEIETSQVDLVPGGRAGWDVAVDRTYRSRTMLPSPFGLGWTSSLFRHLRALPNGNVEYRDAAGEVWLYTVPPSSSNTYVPPVGLLLKLDRTPDGWQMMDMKRRFTTFDQYGRITSESDQFGTSGFTGIGNTIRYLYDTSGRLAAVIDPVGRETKLTYYNEGGGVSGWQAGRVKTITDWRKRVVNYDYDANGRMTFAHLAAVANDDQVPTPTYQYGQPAFGSNFNDALDLGAEMMSITEPSGGTTPLVTFGYDILADANRGRLSTETWGIPQAKVAQFTYSTDNVAVTDVLGHLRTYTLSVPNPASLANPATVADYNADRVHLATVVDNVKVPSAFAYGQLPSPVTSADPDLGVPTTKTTRTVTIDPFTSDGYPSNVTLNGVVTTQYGFVSSSDTSVPGKVLSSVTNKDGFQPSTGLTSKPVAVTLSYGSDDALYVSAISNPDKSSKVVTAEPHRGDTQPSALNDDVTTTQTVDGNTGLPSSVASAGGNDNVSRSSTPAPVAVTYYSNPNDLPISQFLPKTVVNADLETDFKYEAGPAPGTGYKETVNDTKRGIVTVTQYDAWDRPVDVLTTGPELAPHVKYTYDANGRLHTVVRDQTDLVSKNTISVTTTYTYDLLGRTIRTDTDSALVDGAPATSTLTTTADYTQWPVTVTTTLPAGATTVATFDDLGHVTATTTDPQNSSASPLQEFYAYDLAGNLAYQSDTFSATATAYDSSGSVIGIRRSGESAVTAVARDDSGRPNRVTTTIDGPAIGPTQVVTDVTTKYAVAGHVSTVQSVVGDAGVRQTSMHWDGSGADTNVGVAAVVPGSGGAGGVPVTVTGSDVLNRVSLQTVDSMGRVTGTSLGAGDGVSPDTGTPIVQTAVDPTNFFGTDPKRMTLTERTANPPTTSYTQTFDYNTAGDVVASTSGSSGSTDSSSLKFEQHYDEAGNVTSVAAPGMTPTTYTHDGRGATLTASLPDGTSINYQWNSATVMSRYIDQDQQPTAVTVKDALGRPISRTYPDNSTEAFVYDGARLTGYTNRQGKTLAFDYDDGGRLQTVTGADTNNPLDVLAYDAVGRIKSWTTPGVELDVDTYDQEGHPLTTRTVITAFGASAQTLTQNHQWNVYGERTSWTMPSLGTLPNGWTSQVFEDHDEAGNVAGIRRLLVGGAPAPLLSAHFRGSGRPNDRTVTTDCGAASGCTSTLLARTYGYDAVGRLNDLTVQLAVPNPGGSTPTGPALAGSHVTFDQQALRLHDITLHGVSSATTRSAFAYDLRGRVAAAVLNTSDPAASPAPGVAGSIVPTYSNSDFLGQRSRTPMLDQPTRDLLVSKGVNVDAIDPPSVTATEAPAHKIGTFTVNSNSSPVTRTFVYDGNGGLLTDDGINAYTWDEKEQLTSVTQKPTAVGMPVRRISYVYDGHGRIVSRLAETATAGSLTSLPTTWATETDPVLLATDGLPAQSLFAWDPVSDKLVAIYDVNGTIVRQYIHGGLGYDDPIEVTLPAGTTPASGVTRLYPVYDEAGAGSLQAVFNASAQLVGRNVPTDITGANDFSLTGAAVDQVSVTAAKDGSGALQSVTVSVHSTDALDPATVATGLRLSSLDSSGSVVLTTPVQPAPAAGDAFTAQFTLTAQQWTDLTASPAQSLSIGVTSTLRATGWGADVKILPPTNWAQAKGVFTSSTLPVEVRESLTDLTNWLSGVASSTAATLPLYDATSVPLIASAATVSDSMSALFTARFQALPFADPATHLLYARARWYDATTGTFLSPDPMSYQDSSNLYAFAAGDPVNGRDPSGLIDGSDLREDFRAAARNADYQRKVARMAFCEANPQDAGCHAEAVRDRALWKLAGAVGQGIAGVGAISSTGPLPEPVTKTLGWIALVRSIENGGTAIKELWTGQEQDTPGGHAMYLALRKAGKSPAEAARISGWTEVGLDVASTIGSGYVAAKAQQLSDLVNLRISYETEVRSLGTLEQELAANGQTEEQIARGLSAERRAIGVRYKDLTPEAERAKIFARNLHDYGDEYGPTVDYFRAQNKSWRQIIESAKRPGGKNILPPSVINHPAYIKYTRSVTVQ